VISDLAKGLEVLSGVTSVISLRDFLQVIVGDASGEGAQQGIGVGAEFLKERLDHGPVQCGD
jgi:hypothetical protein